MKNKKKTELKNKDVSINKLRLKQGVMLAITAICFVMLFIIQLFEFINSPILLSLITYSVLFIGMYCFVNSIICSMQLSSKHKNYNNDNKR